MNALSDVPHKIAEKNRRDGAPAGRDFILSVGIVVVMAFIVAAAAITLPAHPMSPASDQATSSKPLAGPRTPM